MKQHIGPIYLILGLMSVSALTIGASEPHAARGNPLVRAQALLPSPTSFHFEVSKDGKRVPGRMIVISNNALDAEVEAKLAKALASAARVRKAG